MLHESWHWPYRLILRKWYRCDDSDIDLTGYTPMVRGRRISLRKNKRLQVLAAMVLDLIGDSEMLENMSECAVYRRTIQSEALRLKMRV